MNEFIKKMMERVASLWGKWSMLQRVILIGIVVVAVGGMAALLGVSSAPSLVPVIDAPIRDQTALDRIVLRINQEGEKAVVSGAGLVQVADETTARRMRAILIREDLIPTNIDPWSIFDKERWTITDFERNVNFRRAHTQMITDHIKSIHDVDDANVTIVVPAQELFRSDQNPVTASVIITPRPGSDITTNRKKVEGIQKILKFAIEGLRDEHIVITDQSGVVLNDFSGMAAMDRINIIDKENKLIQQLEAKYRAQVLQALQHTFSPNRVRDLNIKIDMDMS
ncbi:MAG: flagellar M-ring protein FliF, partial [Treponema sp.]|nr:flagellar M-ring protein FliF [Treponema sp.]